MDWEILLIPMIALGVLILSTIFRAPGPERVPRRPRREDLDPDPFTLESQRRRARPERSRTAEIPELRQARPPQPSAPPRQPRPVAEPIVASPIPVSIPVPIRVVEVPGPVKEAALSLAPSGKQPAPPAPRACPGPRSRPSRSPLRAALTSLLGQPENLATAVVLREILDRPLSLRK
jgi:hypothetical protein